jgi:hypothetical protein
VADRLVVADSSPIIALAALDAFDLLRKLFGEVSVTESVRDEVMVRPELPGASELSRAIDDGWISVRPDPETGADLADLGLGESSTLALARDHEGPCLVLLDDAIARTRARELGVRVTGVAGILLAASRAGLVTEVGPILERLRDAGFRISDEVARTIIEAAGEV